MRIGIFTHRNSWGIGYEFCFSNYPTYYGYSKRDAIKQFRISNGLVGKHIKFIWY